MSMMRPYFREATSTAFQRSGSEVKKIGLPPVDKSYHTINLRAYRSSGDGYIEKEGIVRIRKDNEAQKRRVARIENYTCQVCGFYCEYTKKNGSKGWIIEIDHIVDKHKKGK